MPSGGGVLPFGQPHMPGLLACLVRQPGEQGSLRPQASMCTGMEQFLKELFSTRCGRTQRVSTARHHTRQLCGPGLGKCLVIRGTDILPATTDEDA